MAQRELEKLVTVDEFEVFLSQSENAERRFELINGEIVERMPTQLHGVIVGLIMAALINFTRPRKLGWAATEVNHQLPGDEHNSRLPDVSFYLGMMPLVERGPMTRLPDLVVEVKSPDDNFNKMRAKAAYYLANGTRLVWLVYTEKRLVIVLTKDGEDILTVDDTLDGGEVLPGFTLPVRDIFPE
ncbi:MAG: Uma2 family endonuclease [Chloroflexi bacterium]|nr:Uma2 family endonuclease [Chloroflexota bacterium]